MTQHGDGDERIADDQAEDTLRDSRLADPLAVVHEYEKDEPTRSDMRLNGVSIRLPIVESSPHAVDVERHLTHVRQQRGDDAVERLLAVESQADTVEGNLPGIRRG